MEAIGIAFSLEDGSETIPPCCRLAREQPWALPFLLNRFDCRRFRNRMPIAITFRAQTEHERDQDKRDRSFFFSG